jgi:hypothetical protein
MRVRRLTALGRCWGEEQRRRIGKCAYDFSLKVGAASRTSRTFLARLRGEKGFCRKSTSFSLIPPRITESSIYPDIKRTRIPGLMTASRLHSSAPLISGMITSVSNRSKGARTPRQWRKAKNGQEAHGTARW